MARPRGHRAVLLLLACAAGVFTLVEAALRIWMPVPDTIVLPANRYYPSRHPANLHVIMTPDPVELPGTRSPALFSTNALGLRTRAALPLSKPDGMRRVVFLGGSTTECLFVDDAEAWPALVGRMLEERAGGRYRVEDVNAGMSGHTTRDHLATLSQYLIPLQPDLIVLMAGVNDLWLQVYTSDYSPLRLDSRSTLSVDSVLPWHYPLNASHVARALIWSGRRWRGTDQIGNPIQDSSGKYIAQLRARRQSLPYRSLPAQSRRPMPEFEQNMRSLIGISRAHGIPMVLVTQHWLLSRSMSAQDKAMLWSQARSYRFYEGEEDDLLDRFNDVTRNLAEQYALHLVDLARDLPKDRRLFYDDQHVNVYGAKLYAQRVADTAGKALR